MTSTFWLIIDLDVHRSTRRARTPGTCGGDRSSRSRRFYGTFWPTRVDGFHGYEGSQGYKRLSRYGRRTWTPGPTRAFGEWWTSRAGRRNSGKEKKQLLSFLKKNYFQTNKQIRRSCLHVLRTLRKEQYSQVKIDHLFLSLVFPNFNYGLTIYLFYWASKSYRSSIQHFFMSQTSLHLILIVFSLMITFNKYARL